MKRTNEQNARFHALLTQRKIDAEDKQALVLTYTTGRSGSSADMTAEEMAEAIKHLEGLEMVSIKKMRAKIINIAKEIFGVTDMAQTDWDNLNIFLVNKFKGKLNQLAYDQLVKAVTGMQAWKRSKDKKQNESTPIPKEPKRLTKVTQPEKRLDRTQIKSDVYVDPLLIMKNPEDATKKINALKGGIAYLKGKIEESDPVDMDDVESIIEYQKNVCMLTHFLLLQPHKRLN